MADKSNKIVISEFLFFLQNKHGNMPNFNLQNILVSFYNEEEIRASKVTLFDFANTVLDKEEVGRCMKRQGDDRKKLDVADIVHLFDLLDQKKVQLPTFVAANLSRIPGLKPLDGDVLSLSATVVDLNKQVQTLSSSINTLQTKINGNQDEARIATNREFFPELSGNPLIVNLESSNGPSTSLPSTASNARNGKAPMTSQPAKIPVVKSISSSSQVDDQSSWTRVGRNGKMEKKYMHNSYAYNARKQSQPVYGVRDACDSKVRAVTEIRTWHCKIGRLRDDVSEADIVEHLEKNDIKALRVERLHSRQGLPVSMHIEVPYEAKDVVMDSEFWSKGIRVSGWRFRYNNRRVNEKYYGFNWEDW
jgi:hypothetical protein